MPSRPSISGLQAALSSCSIRTTTTTAVPTSSIWATRRQAPASSIAGSRAVSSSPDTFSAPKPTAFPPESPKYIQIPEVRQSNEDRPAKLKGHLPIPRKIFPKRDGDRKIQPSHLEKTAAISAAEQAGLPPKSENEARRRLHAASRREALEQGLHGLWERNQQREQRKILRNATKQAKNRAAALAPEGADDVLTRGTVLASTAVNTAVLPDPLRFEKAAEAARQHEERMARKAEQRRDALTRLYVAAGNFIVDEKELEERINDIFTKEHFELNKFRPGTSIWDVSSVPVSVGEMKSGMAIAASGQQLDFTMKLKSDLARSTERQKEVAEQLTGGKL